MQRLHPGTDPRLQSRLNMFAPLQARRWLRLLQHDPVFGFRFRENLRLPADYLGFTFSTNALGLRGGANPLAGNVILGTSFAMGMCVDDGSNWWDVALCKSDWLNLGLPVGIVEMERMLETLHRGRRGCALFVYHPNLLQQCVLMQRVWRAGGDVFRALRWTTAWWKCWCLEVRRRVRSAVLRHRGELIRLPSAAGGHEIDLRYCVTDLNAHGQLLAEMADRLARMLGSFARAVVLRFPIEQELVPPPYRSPHVDHAVNCYARMWEAFGRPLGSVANVTIHDLDGFDINHYYCRDTHWNVEGNRFFAHHAQTALSRL